MLQLRTQLVVADNSGAKIASMIGLPGKGNRMVAHVGDIITVAIKKADPAGTVKTHEVTRAVVVRTKKERRRPDGSYIRFDDNACVILDAKTQLPKGSRIFGPVARELKQLGFSKIISLSKEIY